MIVNNDQKIAHFYMGANSPAGFNTFYNELETPNQGARSFLIKGGAGTGKSSLMKRVLSECGGTGIIEQIHCSSDPNSLDGIILTDQKISMVDATLPHVIEPLYPGGYQTVVNLCEYLNEQELEARLPEIIHYQTQNKSYHKKCCDMLQCANILLKDSKSYVEAHTNFDKIRELVRRIIKKEIKKPAKTIGIVHKRLLSAITNQGIITYTKTATALAQKIYLIKDEYGVASNAILTALLDKLASLKYTVYACYCPLNQKTKLEHLFVPELSLGFVTESRYNLFEDVQPISVISYSRFIDKSALKRRKQMLAFNRKAASELISSAVEALKSAKETHDILEQQYSPAVDFAAVTKKADMIIEQINART